MASMISSLVVAASKLEETHESIDDNLATINPNDILLRRDLECDVCKSVASSVNKELQGERNEEAIIAAVDNVCSSLPKRDHGKCNTFLEQNANGLIRVLVEEKDPNLLAYGYSLAGLVDGAADEMSDGAIDS
ncbi:hypothetical protein N7481_001413 [Penicillium waksmanii]|uniref:uncharacterized protein n=1 Tax=Penicillium waksmanii TaxID=69791 RepID=UPI002548498F|nr:uncharacterized protein N7481_001413 [Penicillium waksmanii]KAJ6001004.1 hypothetical protein N7481_001413 [Penicillium waksmanii]